MPPRPARRAASQRLQRQPALDPLLPESNDTMSAHDEARQAWDLWHLLTHAADRLWALYEKEFLEFCIEHDREDQQHSDADS